MRQSRSGLRKEYQRAYSLLRSGERFSESDELYGYSDLAVSNAIFTYYNHEQWFSGWLDRFRHEMFMNMMDALRPGWDLPF